MAKKFITLAEVEKNSKFSHYKNFETLGKGANAVVFKADHKVLSQSIAIKVYALFNNDSLSRNNKHIEEIKKKTQNID